MDDLLTLTEVAVELQMPLRSVQDMVKDKKIPHIVISDRIRRVRRSDLLHFLNKRFVPRCN